MASCVALKLPFNEVFDVRNFHGVFCGLTVSHEFLQKPDAPHVSRKVSHLENQKNEETGKLT